MSNRLHIWVESANITQPSGPAPKNRFLYASFQTARTSQGLEARTTTDRTNDLKPVWNEYIRLDVDSPILDVEVSIRDSGPKFMRRRLSSGGAGDYSKKQVNRMLHPEVARGVIAAATIRRGVATPFVRIELQSVGGKDEGEHAGTITLRSQVQYPESLVLPSTAFSVRMLEKFSQDRTPRLVLISVDRVRHLKSLDTPSMFGKPLGHSFIIKMKVQGEDKKFKTPETNCFCAQPVEWGYGC